MYGEEMPSPQLLSVYCANPSIITGLRMQKPPAIALQSPCPVSVFPDACGNEKEVLLEKFMLHAHDRLL